MQPPSLEYSVIKYPDYIEPNYSHTLFRYDALPEWIQDGMRKLDLAGSGVTVPYFGIKYGHEYWFKSVKFSADSGD